MSTKTIAVSKTEVIRRSQIRLNPFNPKTHSDEKIKEQKRNFQRVGYIGGIVWNRTSGNLIDGHRRIGAMDLHYKYDGTPQTDYDVKVEVVEFDDKTEKEQMTYMAVANTKADLSKIGDYAASIDLRNVGLSAFDIDEIMARTKINIPANIETININELSQDEKKTKVKEAKAQQKAKAEQNWKDIESYITLSFSSFESKAAVCELLGYSPDETKFIKGEDLLKILE